MFGLGKEYLNPSNHWMDVVWMLPDEVIYWAVIRALAETSGGAIGAVVDQITAVEVLEHLEKSFAKNGRQI